MNRKPIKILYETSPETVGRLSARLRPAASAMRILMPGSRMFLEVTIDDSIFDFGTCKGGFRGQTSAETAPGPSAF